MRGAPAGWSSTPASIPWAGADRRRSRSSRRTRILAKDNIVNEVDRYIAWPGQALAYKVGEREIRRLRADAEKRLGPKFDMKAFHDLLLGGGAVSLPVLRERIDEWIVGGAAR